MASIPTPIFVETNKNVRCEISAAINIDEIGKHKDLIFSFEFLSETTVKIGYNKLGYNEPRGVIKKTFGQSRAVRYNRV